MKNQVTTQKIKPCHLAAFLISIFSVTVQAENCNELLNLGYMNINHSVSEYDSVVSAYNNFCSTSYDSASSDQKRGLDVSFSFLSKLSGKLGYNWGKTLNQTTWSQICQDAATYDKLSTYQSVDSSEISNIALSAWQNCLALNARGLKSDFSTTQDLTALTGSLYWTGSSPITFLGVDNIGLGKASCSVTAFIGNKYVTKPVVADTTFKLSTKTANFNCQRTTGLDEQSRITAQATRVTFKTSEGKLDVDLAPITLTQIDAKKIDGLYQQIDMLSQRTTAVETLANATANNTPANLPVATSLQNGVVYQNTSKRKYLVSASCSSTTAWGSTRYMICTTGSTSTLNDSFGISSSSGDTYFSHPTNSGGGTHSVCIVPAGYYYKVSWTLDSSSNICGSQVWEM